MKDNKFTKFVFTPAGLCDGTLAVAACRAGGIGILNTELLQSADTAKTIASQLDFIAAKTSAEFGLKLDTVEDELLDLVREYLSHGLRWLIVDSENLPPADKVKKLRNDGIKVLVETRNCHWPDRPEDLAIDALLLKGNEAGGFVGENSTFILLQHWLRKSDIPVFIRGGLTPSVAAAAAALGAAGGVFDSQILLMEESPLALQLKPLLQNLSGNETVAVGDNESGSFFRLLRRPGANSSVLAFIDQAAGRTQPELAELVRSRSGWFQPSSGLFPVGQDICFAGPWRERYGVLSALFKEVDRAVATSLDIAVAKKSLAENSPLARSLNTPLPVVQGPMARVSDRAEFAAAVSRGGGLPVLGLALMRGKPLENLLSETAMMLGKASWGVGLLGFAEKELLDEQLTLISKYHPGYAVVAGGRPEQSARLEQEGIHAFLHIPAPELLALFLREGCRRFIFEGRECGGHIGPVNSLVLWSSMIERLQREMAIQKILPESVEILFAGGIHDALSSAMVQVMAAPLVDQGVKIGILMGSAYLFTKEIVSSRALVKTFQDQVIKCDQTVSLETGPGHASRCAATGFARYFFQKQRQLQREKKSQEEIRRILDNLVLGRLRIASKGCGRLDESDSLCEFDETKQKEEGMYMVGQVAILRDRPTDIVTLHREVTQEAIRLLESRLPKQASLKTRVSKPLDIAIIGIGCLLPGATTTRKYWENILDGKTAIDEIPAHRWDWRLYYDSDRNAKDKIYSRWGGFLEDLPFDPSRYGMPPNSINHVDPMQLMALEIARQTLEDAGYPGKPFCREKTSVIIGASGGTGDVGMQYGLRSELPRFMGKLPENTARRLPEWTEDTFAGLLLNVIAGRIANRLDLHGVNFTTDAACASSLAAIYQGALELLTKRSDMVLAGGVDTVQGPFGYMCFSKTQALSPRGRCETFDASSDGIVISEGIAMVALKRLEDAKRDGDRIYAVIKGVGGSSDGRAKGLTAPLPAGQLRAMKRAYEHLDFGPESVELFEAHGTGTAIGDVAELESTATLLKQHGAGPAQAAIGSVKTLIGHTKAAAGISGLLKVVLSLHHRVLPPHCGVNQPQEIFLHNDAPLYLPDKPRPWLRSTNSPRRGAVSAFGFGGTNFHVVLEEYSEEYRPWLFQAVRDNWPCELLAFSAGDRQELLTQINTVKDAAASSRVELRDLAASLAARWTSDREVMSIVATDFSDLRRKLSRASEYLSGQQDDPGPKIYHSGLMVRGGKLAVLFPGQGAQYPDMLRELALHFPLIADTLAKADTVTRDDFTNRFAPGNHLSHFIFPKGCYDEASQKDAAQKITSTDIAQPALGAVESSLWLLMVELFGLTADMAGGHSYGEFVALFAAGIIDFETLMHISVRRGRLIADIGTNNRETGTMAAVMAPREQVEKILSNVGKVVVANHNAPLQSVISGPTAKVKKAVEEFSDAGIKSVMIPVSAAFHSPLIEGITGEFSAVIDKTDWKQGTMPVYSNTTGGPHADDVKSIKATMTRHLASPLEFVNEIKRMYADGARTFLELGPKSILGGLTKKILEDVPCNIISSEDKGAGLSGLLHMLGRLICAGHQIDLNPLFKGRDCLIGNPLDVSSLSRPRPRADHLWLLNGSGARRINEPVRQVGVTIEDLVSIEESNKKQNLPKKETPDMDKHQGDSADHAELMENYLDMMRQFLETQERVMSMYLQGGGSVTPARRRSHTLRVPRRPSRPSTDLTARPPQPKAGPESTIQSQAPGKDIADKPAPAATGDDLKSGVNRKKNDDRHAPPSQAGIMERDKLTAALLEIVEEKTGYPQDMIGLEQNLEADLGIDSIKRVEIVGELLKVLPKDRVQSMGEEERSQLNTQSTLKGMVDILLTGEEDSRPFDQTGAEHEVLAADLPSRYIIEPVAEPLDGKAATHLTTGFFIITGDDMGLADELAGLLSAKGCKPILLPCQALEDEQSLEQWCAALTVPAGELAGIIHAAPLSAPWLPMETKSDQWRAELFTSEKSFFLLLQRTLPLLHENAHIVSISGLGGSFCRLTVPHGGLSLQGGTAGFIKSLLEEKPNFRLKAIDLDPDLEPSRMAELVLAETELVGGRQEVGYPRGERTIFKTVPAFIPEHKGNMPANMVVFATGGAKGVTAETLRVLAQPGNTLVLAGRTGLPEEEPPELKKLVTLTDIQHYFIEEVRAGRLDLTPAEIKHRAMKILSDRELVANLEDFRSKGANAIYCQLDITDENGVKTLFENLYGQYGAIHGIVHGAGVIEDKLLEDKTAESWSRVVETKVIGLMLLQKYVRPDSLKFFTVFSSVAGRYGNSGQTDYATANELMNRICCQLQKIWPPHVTVKALCWGPWGPTRHGSGMVTPEAEKKFQKKGVALVQGDEGRKLFANEVLAPQDRTVEIICGRGKWEKHESDKGRVFPASASTPFFTRKKILPPDARQKIITLRPDTTHRFLNEHRIDGIAVLPAAAAAEIIAEGVSPLYPGLKIVELIDLRMLNGIKITDSSQKTVLELDPVEFFEDKALVKAALKSSGENGRQIVHYRCTVRLARKLPTTANRLPRADLYQEKKLAVSKAYDEWLFHGPAFRVIEHIDGMSGAGALAGLRRSEPEEWLSNLDGQDHRWILDPAVLDAAPQMGLLWARMFRGESALPVRFGRIIRHDDSLPPKLSMEFCRQETEEPNIILADIFFTGKKGNVVLKIEGLTCVSSKELNRLGGTACVTN
ncbi:SDR family NAD(P)-dependent oxidoreductase [Desulfolithobacter sp.]